MDPKFEKASEIYFRLGIIYRQQQKLDMSLDCFQYILSNPPRPLTEGEVWFQIGHVYEQKKEFNKAKDAYECVLNENPNHPKGLQQLGWLYLQSTSFSNPDTAVSYLSKSTEVDPSDAQTWYLLGRCYMAQQKYNKAYEAYQQAVYRDGRNPSFWCSIGVLYYQINQYRDALDAYSRAIRLNPYISEVWYDLGTLYESCNQLTDALDAYQRAAELDPQNPHVVQRIKLLKSGQKPDSGPGAPSQPDGAASSMPAGAGSAVPEIRPIKDEAMLPKVNEPGSERAEGPLASINVLADRDLAREPARPDVPNGEMLPRIQERNESLGRGTPDEELRISTPEDSRTMTHGQSPVPVQETRTPDEQTKSGEVTPTVEPVGDNGLNLVSFGKCIT